MIKSPRSMEIQFWLIDKFVFYAQPKEERCGRGSHVRQHPRIRFQNSMSGPQRWNAGGWSP